MNVEIETETAQFLSWESINGISFQCIPEMCKCPDFMFILANLNKSSYRGLEKNEWMRFLQFSCIGLRGKFNCMFAIKRTVLRDRFRKC
jgi:hypothetical protein